VTLNLTEGASADTATTPTITYTPGSSADANGNLLVSGSVGAADGAGPALLAGTIIDARRVELRFSEAVQDDQVQANSLILADLPVAGTVASVASGAVSNDAVIVASVSGRLRWIDTTGTAALVAGAVRDAAGNICAAGAAVALVNALERPTGRPRIVSEAALAAVAGLPYHYDIQVDLRELQGIDPADAVLQWSLLQGPDGMTLVPTGAQTARLAWSVPMRGTLVLRALVRVAEVAGGGSDEQWVVLVVRPAPRGDG
jgi:hypothetical protein